MRKGDLNSPKRNEYRQSYSNINVSPKKNNSQLRVNKNPVRKIKNIDLMYGEYQTEYKDQPNDLNNIQLVYDDVEIDPSKLEPFVHDILGSPYFSSTERMFFSQKFLCNYLTNEEYNSKVKNSFIAFFNDKYAGVFNSPDEIEEYAKLKNVKGRYIDIFPITPMIGFERKETKCFSILETKVDFDELTKTNFTSEIYTEFKYKCEISKNQTYIGPGEIYTVDTGSYCTHGPYTNYFDGREYSEYPFESVKPYNKIINQKFLNKNLADTNDFIKKRYHIYSYGIGNVKIARLLIEYFEGVYFIMNHNTSILLKMLIFPRIEVPIESRSIFGNSKKDNQIIRPPEEGKLLGRDVLCRLDTHFKPESNEITKMTIKNFDKNNYLGMQLSCDINLYNDLTGPQNKYEIIIFSPDLILYSTKCWDFNGNDNYEYNINTKFGIIPNHILVEDDSNFSNHFMCVTNKPIFLTNIINTSRENMNSIIEKIINSNEIDGYITTDYNFPYGINIWLKNWDFLINFNNINGMFIEKNNMFNHVDEELQIISTFELSRYFKEDISN